MRHDYVDLRLIISAIREFNDIDPKMQVSTVLTLLEVAANYSVGKETTQRELRTQIGLQSGTMTRNMRYWMGGHCENSGTLTYIEGRVQVNDRRQLLHSLSPQGRNFIRRLLSRVREFRQLKD